MGVTKTEQFILFALGQWYIEANNKLRDRSLKIVVSKKTFIDLVMKAHIAEKKERALYKNLEALEKKRLIRYSNKSLALTKKGNKEFSRIYRNFSPYTNVLGLLKDKDPLSFSKECQTVFSE